MSLKKLTLKLYGPLRLEPLRGGSLTECIFLIALNGSKSIIHAVTLPVYTDSEST